MIIEVKATIAKSVGVKILAKMIKLIKPSKRCIILTLINKNELLNTL